MSYQQELEIANERFRQYVLEAIASLTCNEDDEFDQQYLEILGHMVQDAASRAYGNLNHEQYYITTVGVSSGAAAVFAAVKQEDNSEEPELGPEVLELFPSDDHPVLVGCTSCYLYMMLPRNNPVCLKCNNRAQTVGELENN